MAPIYHYEHDTEKALWTVRRLLNGQSEPLFACATAREALAMTRALRSFATGDASAKCAALRDLGLDATALSTASAT